ncbi:MULTISPECIES: pyridoxamine 5'-phosphate oxidase family protein [unclassified Mesorhizobium]|uniref:pyridoxamine 5'-phosphate oxidase family protein n=1 Tax=unclassified Mesorhizobium TaxID=325217 RepID=UPI002414FFCB|nr:MULTISPECIES: pyridoxamine 5'-phosphate oxidase family protein [unclassified Mesorhizobium]MDG4851430.1 pyridoxamine 5'-phosphate oxidase family protein [Mesorhizobium sp. WSM4982]MDG4912709.1 pyridoxamine 5'-phosphate oxidase family protein [Mesorhizobium sp. WSM4983]
MPTPAELEAKFWKALKSDMTMMIGLDGSNIIPRPMTAQLEKDDTGPIWFFTAKDTELPMGLSGGDQATATFVSKGHDLFATVQGKLCVDNDRAVIDRLWNPYVEAWFEGGKDDPKLTLLRFDPDRAEIWLDASNVVSGIKMLLGYDPKQEYKDNVAKVDL